MKTTPARRSRPPRTPEEADEEAYAQESTRIEPVLIQEEYVRVPSDLHAWNARYTDAVEAHLLAKAARERVEEELRLSIRKDHEDGKIPGIAKMTVDTVDSLVITSEKYQEAVRAEIAAEVRKSRVGGIVEAIRAKREMLVSLGAHLRAEMERDPQVNRRQQR